MNIQILDSWLKEYLKTDATPHEIAEKLSLTSISVEKIEKYQQDYLYDIEITANRPDLMSVVGLAREAAAILQSFGTRAEFIPPYIKTPTSKHHEAKVTIHNDPKLVNRVMAVVMDVKIKHSPEVIQKRLEATGIRSLNNLIDVTNYVMRTIGHPTHVFDYDRLPSKTLTIRESKRGETITTLDGKTYTLPGRDIVADDHTSKSKVIIDLLGVMGLENSAVRDDTKRILYFIDNNEPYHIRKTSMTLGIRTEAAQLNEKGVDPELVRDALFFGIQLFEEIADGKIVSEIYDIYPNKVTPHEITVPEEKINSLIGVAIPPEQSSKILQSLGFIVKQQKDSLQVTPRTFRAKDIMIPEDVIEEIARVYGYHNIPNRIPAFFPDEIINLEHDEFYWEQRVKDALKYWGFTEVYTYPMVSEAMYEGPLNEAVTLQNPLADEFSFMRRTLIPSLLKVIRENKEFDTIQIFEIANVYHHKSENELPLQELRLAGVVKKPHISFFGVKGIIEQLTHDLGIKNLIFKPLEKGGEGTSVYLDKHYLGDIEILDENIINFELDFEVLRKQATLKKVYSPLSKYPPVIEDLAIIAPTETTTGELIEAIKKQSYLIKNVTLLDKYEEMRTFHIMYQSNERNLTSEEVGQIREKILKKLKEKFGAKLKE